MCQLRSIRHDIPVTLHTPEAYDQWPVFDHNDDKHLAVLDTRYGTGWYDQLAVGRWPLQLWLSAWNSSVAPVFHEIEVSTMYSYIPLDLNQLLNIGVDQWLQICIVDNCQWVYVLAKGLFCELVHSFISLNATVSSRNEHVVLVTQWPEQVHDKADNRVLGLFNCHCLQTGNWE